MKSTRYNFILNSIYQIIAILIPLVTTPYLSRSLGANGIGEYSYSFAIANYFVLFIMLGLNNYGSRSIARARDEKENCDKIFWEIYEMQLFIGLIVFLIYILFYVFIFNSIIVMILIGYVLSAILDVNWFFIGKEEFKIIVIRNILVKILTVISIFVFINNDEDVVIYATIMSISLLISNLILWPYIIKNVKIHKVVVKNVLKHIKPNLVLFIPVISVSIYKYMDKIMLGSMSSTVEVGYYENSEKIIQIPMAFIVALSNVMLPKMSNLAQKKDGQYGIYIYKSILFSIMLVVPMTMGIMAVANEFVPLFFGKEFDKCILLFKILLPSCLFIAFANVLRTQFLIPQNREKTYIISVILGAIINMVLNAILIPYLASVGAAIATLAAECIVCIVQAVSVRRELPIVKYCIDIMPFIIGGIIMYVLVEMINLSNINIILLLAIKIIVGIISYIVTCVGILLIKRKLCGWKIMG